MKGVKGKTPLSSTIPHNPFKEGDITFYCGDNPNIRGDRVRVKQVLSKEKVAVGVIGGFGGSKHFECHINDLKPISRGE